MRKPMFRTLIMFTLVSSISLVNANELRVVEDPATGLISKVEFVDNYGNVSKTIKSGWPSGKAVSAINFRTAEVASSQKLLSAKITILPAKNHVLVNVSQARQVSEMEYKQTSLPYDVRHNITLYDHTGKSVSTLMNLPCKPFDISDSANKFLCYYEPTYSPDGWPIGEHADDEFKNWALYIFEFDGNQWTRSKFIGEGGYSTAKMSPNGQWLALPSAKSLPKHTDLLLLYALDKPAGSPPVKILEGERVNRFTRIGNKGEVIIDKINIRFAKNGEPVREIIKTEIIYAPETN